jgi:uncharacterized membrane protein
VITNAVEYEKAEQELRDLQTRLERLQEAHAIGSKGFTKAGIRKMIARIHEELALYEGSEEARRPESSSSPTGRVTPN